MTDEECKEARTQNSAWAVVLRGAWRLWTVEGGHSKGMSLLDLGIFVLRVASSSHSSWSCVALRFRLSWEAAVPSSLGVFQKELACLRLV